MTHQELENIERVIAGLTVKDKQELIERLQHSIRQAEQVKERAQVESLLIQGLDSGPATPMTNDDWDAVEQEGLRLIAERKTQRAR